MSSIFFIPQVVGPIFIQGLYVSLIITFVGMGMIAIGSTWGGYLRRVKILQSNFSPPITVTKDYAVTKHGNTYIFSYKRGAYGLYFAALKQASIVPAEGIQVPKRIWRSSPGAHFEGLRVRDSEGTFSVPTPSGDFISGEGILLAVSTYHPSYLVVGLAASVIPRSHITQENLREVAEYAERYISQKPDDGLNSPGF